MIPKRTDRKDHNILLRHAKSINAEVSWHRSRNSLEIIIQAPPGFVWANSNEPSLIHETELPYARDAVRELIDAMSEGYIGLSIDLDNEEYDPEIAEIRFD